MTTDVASLVIRVDALEAANARSKLDELSDAAKRSEGAANSASTVFSNFSGVLRRVAASYAVLKVAEYVKDAAMLHARYETLGVSMKVVGANAGYTSEQMESAAVAMQKTGISMNESRQQAMRLVQAHIDLSASTKLARIAQDAAVIGNMNSSEAFASMIHGIQTGQTEVLRTIGINVSMEQSYQKLAAQLGIKTNALTQNQKTQAILNAVMESGTDIAGTYEAAMGTAGKQINSMTRYSGDLKVKLGETFNETLTMTVMAMTSGFKDANGELDEMAKNNQIKVWAEALTDTMIWLADGLNDVVIVAQVMKSLTAGSYAGAVDMKNFFAYRKQTLDDIDKILEGYGKFERARDKFRADKELDSITVWKPGMVGKEEGVKFRFSDAKAKRVWEDQETFIKGVSKPADTVASTNGSADKAKAAADKQKKFLDALNKEARQLGMTELQVKLYEASLLGIHGANLKLVGSQMDKIDAYKREQETKELLMEIENEAAQAQFKWIEDTQKGIEAADASNARLEYEITLIGKNALERDELLKRYDIEIKYKERLKELGDVLPNKSGDQFESATASAREERDKQLKGVTGGAKLAAAKKEADEMSKIWERFAENTQKTLGDQMFNILQGKFDNIGGAFKSMIDRMAADAMAAQLSKLLFGDVGTSGGGGFGGGGGMLGSLFSGGSNAMASAGADAIWSESANSTFAMMFHSGGIVGATMPGKRVSADVFHNAPRFHEGGLVSGEVPIIAKKGERVLTEDQQKDYGRKVIVTNNFTITGTSTRASEQQIAAAAGASVQRAINRNS